MIKQHELKERRLKLGLTQKQVADKLGIHFRTWRRYENLEQIVPYWNEHKIRAILVDAPVNID